MPELDQLLTLAGQLFVAAFTAGWAGVVSVGLVMVSAIVLYYKVRAVYRKSIDKQNKSRQEEAEAKNPVDNKTDEASQQKAEDEIEDILKGGK